MGHFSTLKTKHFSLEHAKHREKTAKKHVVQCLISLMATKPTRMDESAELDRALHLWATARDLLARKQEERSSED